MASLIKFLLIKFQTENLAPYALVGAVVSIVLFSLLKGCWQAHTPPKPKPKNTYGIETRTPEEAETLAQLERMETELREIEAELGIDTDEFLTSQLDTAEQTGHIAPNTKLVEKEQASDDETTARVKHLNKSQAQAALRHRPKQA